MARYFVKNRPTLSEAEARASGRVMDDISITWARSKAEALKQIQRNYPDACEPQYAPMRHA